MLSWERDLIVRASRPKGLFIHEGSSDVRSRRVKCNSVLSHMGYAAARHPSKTRVCSHSLVAKYPNWSERRLVSEAESDIPPSRSKLAEMREMSGMYQRGERMCPFSHGSYQWSSNGQLLGKLLWATARKNSNEKLLRKLL